jgi:Spy/CpxP family protein refolding chaperone
MKNNRKVIAGLVTAAALAASGSFVYAQTERPAGPGADHGSMHSGMMGHGPRGDHKGGHHGKWSNPKAAVEGHLAALKVELKITPNQETAWQAFSNKARQQADAMIARREQMKAQAPGAAKTAPEILAQRTERMKQGLASMETMTAAVKDLYGVLTPEQKTLADQHLARGPMGGFGGGRGGHEHRRS